MKSFNPQMVKRIGAILAMIFSLGIIALSISAFDVGVMEVITTIVLIVGVSAVFYVSGMNTRNAILSSFVVTALMMTMVAGISGDNGTLSRLIMSTELRLKTTARIQTYGNSYIDFGDSSYVVRGARFAGVDSFATTQTADTLAFSGIAAGAIFQFTEIKKSSTASLDTIIFAYFAKTDTCFVYRAQRLATSTADTAPNYSWIRIK